MKLQHRVSLFLILTYSIAFFVAAAFIYFLFSSWLLNSKLRNLEDKTLLAAMFYLEEDEISAAEHQSLREQLRRAMSRSNIAVYDLNYERAKGEMPEDKNITTEKLANVLNNSEKTWVTKDYFYHGLLYYDNQGDFIVVTRDESAEYLQQKSTLLQILIIVFLAGIAIMYIVSAYLGKFAYKPIINIIQQMKERDAQNFNDPIMVQKSYAEIEDLVITYNHFVERIAQTFYIQKNFIDYVSHELRTPITALLGTLDVSNLKSRTVAEHESTIVQLKQYVQDLESTLDNMMLLSGAKTSFEFQQVRIDEIIWHVIENAFIYHNAQIDVELNVENPALLTQKANIPLLELALTNLVENAIKYSNNQPIKISINYIDSRLSIDIIDQGIGILETDLQHITSNFYRGKNTQGYQGKGIGLSMANIIFKLHQITMEISSNSVGTKVRLLF